MSKLEAVIIYINRLWVECARYVFKEMKEYTDKQGPGLCLLNAATNGCTNRRLPPKTCKERTNARFGEGTSPQGREFGGPGTGLID